MNVLVLNKIKEFNSKHHNLSLVFIGILMAFLTGILSDQVTSFIYPISCGGQYVSDPNCFYYMGKLFVSGYTPYVEFFDQKGPYIFYLTGLANILGGRYGMLLLHIIIFGIFYYYLFKIYEEYKFSKILSISMTLVLLSIIIICGQNPSDSELEFPFISCGLYFYIKGINNKNDKYFLYGNIICGLCAGIAIHLRLTEAIIPFGLVVYFGIRGIINKKYKNIIINAGACICGVIITSMPPLIHSLCLGFTQIMYEAIILNNFTYASGLMGGYSIESMLPRLLIIILFIFVGISLFVLKKKNKISFDETLFYGILFTVVLILEYITSYYLHYLLIVFPLIIIYFGRVISFVNINKIIKYVLLVGSFVIFIESSVTFPIYNYNVVIKRDYLINEYIDDVINIEDRNGKVLCYFTSPSIYINNNIMVSYPDFSYQGNHNRISNIYTFDRLRDYLINSDCKYVIFDNEIRDEFTNWLENNEYYVKDNSKLEGSKYITILVSVKNNEY